MSVVALRRGVLLVPHLVKIMHAEMSAKACRKRGIGLLRKRYDQSTEPEDDAPKRILAEICRHCPLACDLARRPE